MAIIYTVTGTGRKALVTAMSEILEQLAERGFTAEPAEASEEAEDRGMPPKKMSRRKRPWGLQ